MGANLTKTMFRLVCGLACVWLVVAFGCSTSRSRPILENSPAEDLPILWEKSGTYSRLTRSVRIVARDRAALAQVPIAEVPVDFDSQMALIAGLGPTPTNDLGIRITRVWREGTQIHVEERQIHPGLDRAPGLHPASPWTVVIIPKSDLNVAGYSTRIPKGLLGDHPGDR